MQIATGRTPSFRVLKTLLSAAVVLPVMAYSSGQAAAMVKPATAGVQLAANSDQPAAAPAAPAANPPAAPAAPAAPDAAPAASAPAAPATADGKQSEVLFDITKAPEAVQKMRKDIMDAAAAGDVNKVAALLKAGPTDMGPDNNNTDLAAALHDMSGDGDGLEILSIMMDVLSSGYAHVGAGTKDEMYVWPYFTAKQLDKLTPSEKVDLMRLVTAGDFADMQEYGSYNFYRVGITPDGHWKYFLSGN